VVRFRLLGDVEAEVGGRLLELGHARQRCVLVALLVDANRVVPTEELIARVWGQRAPQRVRSSVYGYVSRLRQILTAGDGVRIIHQPTGYRLVADPLMVDMHQFQHLTRRARDAGTPAAALALLEQALQLWRDKAFASLDTVWLGGIREDLHRQRRAAELDRNDLALGLGRHAELLVELSSEVEAAPLDERLVGQLMLALYRSGRQVDALAHYHQVRLRLAEELGTDPGPALQDRYQQVLTADQALDIPTAAVARRTEEPGAPRQLPAPPGAFAGRVDELAYLDTLLTRTGLIRTGLTRTGPIRTGLVGTGQPMAVAISAISGTAGVGKTALALHWAHRVAECFPDGQLYVNLRGFDPTGQVLDPVTAVRRFLDALGLPPQRIPPDLDAQAALYRSQLAGRRVLIVLDNARDTIQVRPLLPGAPGCLVLITSRSRLTGLVAAEGAFHLTLDVLSGVDARKLLAHHLGAARMAAEPEAVDQLITYCARLPLALAIVAAHAATNPRVSLQALAGALYDTGTRLDALSTDDPCASVRTVFSWSYRALTPGAARLFRLLGLHPGPDISAPAAASLAALRVPCVRRLLVELVQANLLVESAPGRYTFHDLLRAYATEQARVYDNADQVRGATNRMLDHYLHTAHSAARLLHPATSSLTIAPPQRGVTPEDVSGYRLALTWFDTEHAVLVAAVDRALSAGFDGHAWQLAETLKFFLDRRGHWHDWVATARAGVAATDRLADPATKACARRNLAIACIQLGHFDDAHDQLRHALKLATRTLGRIEQAHTHFGLAHLWDRQGRPARALEHAQRALDLYCAAGHQQGRADACNAVGWCHAQLGNHPQALAACQQSLALYQQRADRYGQAAAWDSLGYVHNQMGHHVEAINGYHHALALLRDLGDRYHEATTLVRLGDSHHAIGGVKSAHDVWQQALAILDELDHPDAGQLRTKLASLDTWQ